MADAPWINLKPIGYVRCGQKYRYEAPRQAVLAENQGVIELEPGMNFEAALTDLDGFDHIWIIFAFHLNNNWKPKVTPPVKGHTKKIGVLATRSPHRPNPLGMSCVKLIKIQGRKLFIENFDMLDGTPVLDIKPYIVLSDSHPEASRGWLPDEPADAWMVEFSPLAAEQAVFIKAECGLDLEGFCRVQLAHEPFSAERKRISSDDDGKYYVACRTWTVAYCPDHARKCILASEIKSNYSADDLRPDAEDIYNDKELHRKFNRQQFLTKHN